jgi:hypothetical protein
MLANHRCMIVEIQLVHFVNKTLWTKTCCTFICDYKFDQRKVKKSTENSHTPSNFCIVVSPNKVNDNST